MSETIQRSYDSLSLLFALNWDRLLYISAISMALLLAAFMCTMMA